MKKILVLTLILSLIAVFGCSKSDTELISGEWKAKLIQISGKVEVIKDGVTQPAEINMILTKDDTIQSYAGTVDFKIANLGLVKVKPNTTLKLSEMSEDSKLTLKKGKILLALNKLKKTSTFHIDTPTAVAGVRGTSFLVTASKLNSKIGVLTGSVEVRTSRGVVTVNELKEVRVSDKELAAVSTMNISTIVDVKSIMKIKNIETMNEFTKIKSNIKKLEIIESGERVDGIDVDALKRAIKAKEIGEDDAAISEALKKKSADIKSSQIDTSKQKKLLSDPEF